jgi:hypothetical protein
MEMYNPGRRRVIMGNHDVYDTSEDIAHEQAEKNFQETVRAVHNRLKAMPADGRFTVDELGHLLSMPHQVHRLASRKYTKENLAWLTSLEEKVSHCDLSGHRPPER